MGLTFKTLYSLDQKSHWETSSWDGDAYENETNIFWIQMKNYRPIVIPPSYIWTGQ